MSQNTYFIDDILSFIQPCVNIPKLITISIKTRQNVLLMLQLGSLMGSSIFFLYFGAWLIGKSLKNQEQRFFDVDFFVVVYNAFIIICSTK